MEYLSTNEIHENNWSLKLKTILRTPHGDFVLKMDNWPDGVSICQWDSRKQLESRIENNSPYSILTFCFEKWMTDQMEYRFTDEIHENNWSLELKTILRTTD